MPNITPLMSMPPSKEIPPMEEIEASAIRFAIAHYRGRITEVSRRLGIGRSTLYRKLKDLGLEGADPEGEDEPTVAAE